jgi:hypothetical protein
MSDSNLPSHSAAVLFESLPQVSQAQVESLFSQHFPSAQVVSGTENSYIVNIANMDFAVLVVDKPYPQADLEALLPFNYTLKNGDEIVKKQTAHIIISVLTPASNQAQAIGQAITITHLSAVVSQLADIQAVLWMNSGSLQNADMFNATLKTLNNALNAQKEGEPAGALLPLTFWTPVRMYSPDQGKKTFGAYSHGLNAFIGLELDLLPQPISAQQSAEQLLTLLVYQFQSGVEFKVGDTLDIGGAQLKIKKSEQPNKLSVVCSKE